MALAAAPPSFGLPRVFLTINQQVRRGGPGGPRGRGLWGARAPLGRARGAAPRVLRPRVCARNVGDRERGALGIKSDFLWGGKKKKKERKAEGECAESQAQASRVSHAFSFFLFCECDFFLSFFSSALFSLLPLLPLVGLRHLSLRKERLQTAVAPGVRRVKFSRPGGGKTNPHLPKKEVSGRCPLPLAAPLPLAVSFWLILILSYRAQRRSWRWLDPRGRRRRRCSKFSGAPDKRGAD